MKTLFQLEIPRRGNVCVKGNEALIPGMEYFSVLVEDPELGLKRLDYCPTCWAIAKNEVKARSQWKAKVLSKKEEAPIHLNRDERILYLFKESTKEDTPEAHIETFVLALFLARRRLMYLRQEVKQDDGTIIQLYEEAATEEMYTIRKVDLSQVQISTIQLEVAKKLK